MIEEKAMKKLDIKKNEKAMLSKEVKSKKSFNLNNCNEKGQMVKEKEVPSGTISSPLFLYSGSKAKDAPNM